MSTQHYNIISKVSGNWGGITYYNFTTKTVDIEVDWLGTSSTFRLAHELKHAYQFETGKLSFNTSGKYGGALYDITDEVEAYKRSQLFGAFSGEKINADWVYETGKKTGNYQGLPETPRSMSTIFVEGFPITYGDLLKIGVKNKGRKGETPLDIYIGWEKDYAEGQAEGAEPDH